MSEQLGARALFEGLKQALPSIIERLPEMPDLLYSLASQAERGDLKIEWESQQLKEIRDEIHLTYRRTMIAIAAAALLVLVGIYLSQ
jgi:ubiquinone biosynthesis protein